ncbi:MAG: hypothetical protein K2X38_09570 [Gemmataceae bacterium]|nr:hypothetical protein [Gemmataceae bacterium]
MAIAYFCPHCYSQLGHIRLLPLLSRSITCYGQLESDRVRRWSDLEHGRPENTGHRVRVPLSFFLLSWMPAAALASFAAPIILWGLTARTKRIDGALGGGVALAMIVAIAIVFFTLFIFHMVELPIQGKGQVGGEQRDQARLPTPGPAFPPGACGTCGRVENLSSVSDRRWCAWCNNWAGE